MTLNGIGSKSQAAYAARPSAAIKALTNLATSANDGAKNQATPNVIGGPRFNRPGAAEAQAKLKQIDPSLADKMNTFHDEVDKMRGDGASRADIGAKMKDMFSSLSDTEKKEISSAFGRDTRTTGDSGALTHLSQKDERLASALSNLRPKSDPNGSAGGNGGFDVALTPTLTHLSDAPNPYVMTHLSSDDAAKVPTTPPTPTAAGNNVLQARLTSAYTNVQSMFKPVASLAA